MLSTHAAMGVLIELGPKFERATGNRLSIGYDPAKAVKRQIENGVTFDVAIVTRPVFDDLAAQGKILPETRADIGRSGLGLAVRKGAPKPDIATTEAFKRALLTAKSVVRSTEGTSGIYFEKLLDRLGITETMASKIVLGPSGRVAELVARGEADMAVQQIAELLPVTGAQYAGPFPPELQLYSEFAAGVATASKHREAAKAYIATLTTPEAIALFKAAGLEPILH
ncbi:MAG TPA: substrate-binding domain-containing protein [Pseudolabrys sp.]|nr:substrate-binding domain-containing protein [Pseudolabrys sp.]